MEKQGLQAWICFVLILWTQICCSTNEGCVINGDPRGNPRQMNQNSTTWLHIFKTMSFNVNSTVRRIEYFANRSGRMYVSFWRNAEEQRFELMSKILMRTQVGQHIYEVPTAERVAVHPGYVVGVHYPQGTTQSILTWENPREPASPGILHTHNFHEKLTKLRQDDGWELGYTVAYQQLRRRAIPLTVYAESCEEEPSERDGNTPNVDSKKAKKKDKSELSEEQQNEALAVGLAIPFTAITVAAVVIGYMLWRKKYICKTHNKVKTYVKKCEPSKDNTSTEHSNEFYDLYTYYMQQENEEDPYVHTADSKENELDNKQLPREMRDSGYLSEPTSQIYREEPDPSYGHNPKRCSSQGTIRSNDGDSEQGYQQEKRCLKTEACIEIAYDMEKETREYQVNISDKSNPVSKASDNTCTALIDSDRKTRDVTKSVKEIGRSKKDQVSAIDLKGKTNYSMYEDGDESDEEIPNTSVGKNNSGQSDTSFASSGSCDLPDNSLSTNGVETI